MTGPASRVALAALAVPIGMLLSTFAHAGVWINEIQSSNSVTIKDENGDASDWVELYNDGTAAVNLQGWGLSDSASTPFKWTFGSVSIQPGQRLLVWASNKNRPNGPQIHTSWAISAAGEPILLTQPDGTRADEFPSIAVARDTSMGRKPEVTGPLNFFAAPTPGAANTTVGTSVETLARPTFSVAGGMYTGAVTVSIASSVSGGTVRYTLDGSDPTESSSIYTGPITLSSRAGQANVYSAIPTNYLDPGPPYYEGWQAPAGEVFKIHPLRARVFRSGSLPSRITTQSYLVDPQGAGRYPFPMVSLNTTPANLFDSAIGIYVPDNYYNEGSAWERPGHIEFYEQGGALAFQGEVGIRIHGNTTVSRPRKALRIYARNPTGNQPFSHQIFPEKDVDAFDTFLLRAAGNDWGHSIFRDALVSDIASPTGLDRMSTRPAVVFIDGEYWGIHNVRDRIDEGYHFHHYALGENDYTQLEIWSGASPSSAPIYDRGNPAMLSDYQDILARAATGEFATASGYASLEDRIDVGNFIDYSIHQIWCGNTDWPGNNVRLWRKVVPDRSPGAHPRHDGRWRWILYDADFALALNFSYVPGWNSSATATAQYDCLAHATAANGTFWSNNEIGTRLLRKCLDNATFRQRFITRACDLLNTTLSAAGATYRLDVFQTLYAPGMTEHVARWRQPTNWLGEIARLRTYMQARPTAMFGHIVNKFGLAGTAQLTVDVDDQDEGVVRVNSILLDAGTAGVAPAPYPWSGLYMRGVPVAVTAVPREGFRFAGWVDSAGASGVDPDSESVQVLLSGSRTIRASFEPLLCLTDLDGSGEVDPGDIAIALLDFGPCGGCPADLDGTGEVDFADVALILVDFGSCPGR
ncbi:MAG: CotH kinase family protein [Phycisphaerales bacterium]